MRELEPNDPNELKDGRYRLVGIIGEGSMGRTYLAEDADADSGRVAIKALYPSRLATMKDLELFHREAQVLQKLSHPRIPSYVDAFDQGEGEGVRYYLVQQFVEGQTLREKIADGSRWDEGEMVGLARQLLSILRYMHEQEPVVVHRDIKPDNIVMRPDDGAPTLVDFGAVREVVRLTMGGGSTIIGTYGYMPPEQLMGRSVPASDLYSLGVTLLEVLTRQTPKDLHGVDVERLIRAANVSEEVRRVLGRLCAPSLEDRYSSAEQALGDLEAATKGGALVHASQIESEIDVRRKEEENALKKSSTPGFIHLGYITLLSLVVLAAAVGLVILVQAVAQGFQAAFIVAGLVSGGAMFAALMMLGLRYTHDAWQPPDEKWKRTRARVEKLRERYAVDQYGAIDSSRTIGYVLLYSFDTPRGLVSGELPLPPEANLERYEVGREFDLYYHPGKPEWQEIQDFHLDPDDAMGRLFSPSVKHTPE